VASGEHSDLNCIAGGRRGELVATLLIMQPTTRHEKSVTGRYVSVEFMGPYFRRRKTRRFLQIWAIICAMESDTTNTFRSIQGTTAVVQHVISSSTRDDLIAILEIVTRGALILCATVDGIACLPVPHMRQNGGLILCGCSIRVAKRSVTRMQRCLMRWTLSSNPSCLSIVRAVPDTAYEETSEPAEPSRKETGRPGDYGNGCRLVFPWLLQPAGFQDTVPGRHHSTD